MIKMIESLPEIMFDCQDPCFDDCETLINDITDLDSAIRHINTLKERINRQSYVIDELVNAYNQLKKIILEGRILDN